MFERRLILGTAYLWGAFVASLFVLGAQEEEEKAPERPGAGDGPNFVLILADDLSWQDCSPYGHDSIMTPHLAKLAAEGMRFDQAYVTTGTGSASRAGILTGSYPHQADAEQSLWPVPAGKATFVEILRRQGYWTGAAGKWHMGDAVKDHFDLVVELEEPKGGGDRPEDWIALLEERATGQPFFLWLGAHDPARPYGENILDDPARPEEVKLPPYHPDTPAVRADYQKYYDEITRLDQHLGEFLAELDRRGLADDTVVLFLSDNGRPFPRDKGTLYDSGIRVPWIVRWPGRVTPGTVTDHLVSSVDIARTVLGLAGAGHATTMFEGVDVSPLFTAPSNPLRDYIYAEKNWHDFEDRSRAVRNGRYKYIRNHYHDLPLTPPVDVFRSPTYMELVRLRDRGELTEAQERLFAGIRSSEELYDVKADPGELHNLIHDERYAPVAEAMRAALADWEKKTGDVAPKHRMEDAYDRITGRPLQDTAEPRLTKEQMLEKGLLEYEETKDQNQDQAE